MTRGDRIRDLENKNPLRPSLAQMSDEDVEFAYNEEILGKWILYHGSEFIIDPPVFGKGEASNDYGLGFYMTRYPELAAEWACHGSNKSGIVNKYEVYMNDLKVLNMDEEPLEHWISILVQNRDNRVGLGAREFMNQFIQKYPINTAGYDVIKGWRADDSYYAFIRAFFSAALSLEQLRVAMRLGEYGTQYCLISEKSFKQVKHIGNYEVNAEEYYMKRCARDIKAKESFDNIENKTVGTLIVDILRR